MVERDKMPDTLETRLRALEAAPIDRIVEDVTAHQQALLAAIGPAGADFAAVPPMPWAVNPFAKSDSAASEAAALKQRPETIVFPGEEALEEIRNALRMPAESVPAPAEETPSADEEEGEADCSLPTPPRPDWDAGLDEWVEWHHLSFENAPSFNWKKRNDYSFEELLEIARWKLVEEGTEFAIGLATDALEGWLTDWLSEASTLR